MQPLINELLGLKGEIPEHIRGMVVRRVARALHNMGDESGVVGRLLVRECHLEEGDPIAPPRVPLKRDKLAKFIDRWVHACQVRDLETGELRPINPDENCIRCTMCVELLELSGIEPSSVGLKIT